MTDRKAIEEIWAVLASDVPQQEAVAIIEGIVMGVLLDTPLINSFKGEDL